MHRLLKLWSVLFCRGALSRRGAWSCCGALVFGAVLYCTAAAKAQMPDAPPATPNADAPAASSAPLTMFPHNDASRYLIAGQANIVFQAHPGFHSPYSDTNSLLARGEYKTSLIGTLYLGYKLIASPHDELDAIYNEESAGGRGISEALGLAGFTNLDVVRNPTLGPIPYLARVQLSQTIGLSQKLVDVQRNVYSLATKAPERRVQLRAGKMSLPDFLDINNPGTDSHLQFLNWTVDNNGAWDYAADTRGYTYAFIAEYDDADWSVRYAIALMPVIANGTDLQWNLRRASGQNMEIEYRKTPLAGLLGKDRKGTVRLLGFVNHANMGDYRVQNNAALYARAHGAPAAVPNIMAHPAQVTVKYGVGLNFEQELTANARVFGRFGWNEGQHESFAYTEVDQTFELGADYSGAGWGRAHDRIGVVGVSNAIKRDHQQYLALGGLGFLLGDGRLNYGREDILEAYYTAHNWRGLFSSFDLQLIAHPGYNQDRGPVEVFTVRTHVDF
jgi:high affinity Mn2+ porin